MTMSSAVPIVSINRFRRNAGSFGSICEMAIKIRANLAMRYLVFGALGPARRNCWSFVRSIRFASLFLNSRFRLGSQVAKCNIHHRFIRSRWRVAHRALVNLKLVSATIRLLYRTDGCKCLPLSSTFCSLLFVPLELQWTKRADAFIFKII
jgi:hypothetical protein